MDSRGIPGTIQIFHHSTHPSVIRLQANWTMVDVTNLTKDIYLLITIQKKIEECGSNSVWMKLVRLLIKKIAFPFKIGCGLAGSDWSVYNILTRDFSRKHGKDVLVIVLKILKRFLWWFQWERKNINQILVDDDGYIFYIYCIFSF